MKNFYILFLLLLSFQAKSTNYFVKADASGANNGFSWGDAFTNLQPALSIAVSGDSIFVAKGIYTPDVSNRNISFHLITGVTILGGFNGSESVINQSVIDSRDFFNNESILSGDLNQDDQGFINNSENSYHVVVCDGAAQSGTLNGFTITGGNANSNSGSTNDAGGIWVKNYANNSFKNLNVHTNYGGYWGGAVYLENSTTSFVNCTFTNNNCPYFGAAILAFTNVTLSLTNVIIWDNITGFNTRQLYIWSGVCNVKNCLFELSGGSSAWDSNYGTDLGGNLDIDPILVDASVGDVRLMTGSPAIGTGDGINGVNIGIYQGSPLTPSTVSATGSLTTFPTTYTTEFSAEQSISVSGTSLLGNILVTAPVGWGVSLTSNDFSGNTSQVQIVPTGGVVAPTPVYVSFNPQVSGFQSDSIVVSSAQANIVKIYAAGTGINKPEINIYGTINGFGDYGVGYTTQEQSYAIDGQYLLDDITIVAPDGFEITTISGDYTGNTDTIILQQSGGYVYSPNIYVRFAPTAAQSYIGNISHTTPDANTQNIAVSGTGVSTPLIIVNGTIGDFGSNPVNFYSSIEKSYSIQAMNLTDDILITAPAGFLISLTSGNFTSNTLTLTPTNGELTLTEIYVQFYPTSAVSYSGDITNVSNGATAVNLSVSGQGITPNIIYVNSFATGVNDGSSWTDAFTDLQLAISASVSGDIIVVAKGTYKPSLTDRTISFVLKEGVRLYGGFNGTEVTIDNQAIADRDIASNETILSGDLNEDDDNNYSYDNPLRAENSYHVINVSGSSGNSISSQTYLDGFIVQSGNANGSGTYNEGGGIRLNYADITISNTIIRFNSCYSSSTGGAGAILKYSNAYFKNVEFLNNSGKGSLVYGGGVYNYYSNPTYYHTLFKNNQNTGNGGGMANRASNTTIINTSFLNNSATFGGGMYSRTGSVPVLVNTLFWENPIGSGFDPIYNSGSTPEYSYCLIYNSGGSLNWNTVFGNDLGHNYDEDPYYFDPLNDDYRFPSNSVIVGNGNLQYGNNIGYDQGAGELVPTVTISGTVNDFGNVLIGNFSAEQSYSVEGANLADDILITAPTDFQITTISGDYTGNTSTIVLTQTSGTVDPTTIYVRFVPQTVQYYNNLITHLSTGAITQNLTVSGTGILPPRLFVKSDATGNNDGSDWANAFTDLQSALSASNSGDTIFVASGTYIPSLSLRSSSFMLRPNVKIFGGFAGNEFPINQTVINNRDFVLHETILSGDLNNNDIEFANNTENSYHVVRADASVMGNLFETTVLNGFTISGGNANGTTTNSRGGGIYIYASSFQTSNPLLSNLKFINNSAGSGGALYCYAANNYASCIPAITNTEFSKNRAYGAQVNTGGAVYILSALGNASPLFTNVIFSENNAYNDIGTLSSYGGAVYVWASNDGTSSPIFDTVLFYKNSSEYQGAAVYNRSSTSSFTECNPQFINATFVENTSAFGVTESAVFNNSDGGNCYPEIINTILWNENALEIENNGGANAYISYSLIRNSGGSTSWDNTLGVDFGNNIDTNPLFLDMLLGDVTLIDGSPALNTGNSSYGNNIGYYQQAGYITPLITLTGTLNNFGTIDVGNSSSEQSFIVQGTNLQDNITITAPAGFEISLTSGNYTGNTDTISLIQSAGTVSATTIYVRFSPVSAITYNGSILAQSTGATMQYISVSGTGNTSQGIIIGGNLTYFGTINVGGASAEQSYYVKGIGLTTDITITAPANFQITTSSGNYSGNTSQIVLSQTGGTVDSTVIYVRFSPPAATYYSGNINHSSSGVSDVNLFVSGMGNIPPWIFVNDDAAGNNDGTSWTNAFNSLQSALGIASAGDSIFVASGTYIPHTSLRTATFNLKSGVKIFGGFAGNESINSTVIANRDFELNEAILSGDLYGNDNGFTNNFENSYHIVSADAYVNSSISSSALLDGFTIKGGNADDVTTSTIYNSGGGIYCRGGVNKSSSPTLKNLKFYYNKAKYGGGIYIDAYTTNGVASPSMYNMIFDNNLATYAGGAMYNFGSVGTCSPVINQVIFSNNTAQGYDAGGAIYNYALTPSSGGICSPVIKNALFFNNSGSYYAGAISNKAGQATGNYGGTVTVNLINATIISSTQSAIINRAEGTGSGVMNFTNVILWNENANEVLNYGNFTANYQYSLVQGSNGSGALWNSALGTDNGNNYDADPEFVDMSIGDVTLKSISPALNTGNSTYGNNIGYYQGPGVVIFAINSISDLMFCDDQTLQPIQINFTDNNPDDVTFTVYSSDLSFIDTASVSITGSGSTRTFTVNALASTFGSTIITINGTNGLGATSSVSFEISIAQKPVVEGVNIVNFNSINNSYTINITPSDNILYDYFMDGNQLGSFYVSGIQAGNHTFNILSSGCSSDDFVLNLPAYVNNVDIEVFTADPTVYNVCTGTTIPDLTFIIRDDSLQNVTLDTIFLDEFVIPASAATITQINDSTYTLSINMQQISTGYARIYIRATNIYAEMNQLMLEYNIGENPDLITVQSEYVIGNSSYCIYPEIMCQVPGWVEISVDGGQTWDYYNFNSPFTTFIYTICDLMPGTYQILAREQGCESNIFTISLPEYVNNVPLQIELLSESYQTICDNQSMIPVTFTVRDDSLHQVGISGEFYASGNISDSLIVITQLNDSTFTLSFENDTVFNSLEYCTIILYANNIYGESMGQYLNFHFSSTPIFDTIIATQNLPGSNYCFNISFSNISDFNGIYLHIFDGQNTYTSNYQYPLCEYSPANYTITADNSGCMSQPFILNLLGIDEILGAGFKIYPNPTNEKLFIDVPENFKNYSIRIFDITGRIVGDNIKTNLNHSMFDFSGYESGIYEIRIFNDKNSYSCKVVVQ